MTNRAILSGASLDRIEKAVAEAEMQTSCEYVVVLAPASSRYEGRVLKAAAAVAVIVYVALYWVNGLVFEINLDPMILLLEAGLAGAVFALLFSRLDSLRRVLIPRWAMSAAVDAAAHSTFSLENTSLTTDRNAVLIYVSVLEGEVRLMPDIGLVRKLPEGALGEIEGKLRNAETGDGTQAICDAVSALAGHCKACFPFHEADANELPDRPQIRLP